MKKLFSFLLLIAIAGWAYYLIRSHDGTIPLSRDQLSPLSATHYASEKDIPITNNSEENEILRRLNSLRAGKGVASLKIDKSAALLARYHSALMRSRKKLAFDLAGQCPLEIRKTIAGISEPCFYVLYADISISRLLEQIESEKDPLYAKDNLTHIGIGAVKQLFPYQYWVTIIYVKRIALLNKFPIYVPRAGSVETLRWKLKENHNEPAVKMTTPGGFVRELTVKSFTGGVYESRIPFPKEGEYIVEILANGPYGMEVAHVMPVYVKVERKEDLTHRKERLPDKDEESLEKEMFELINRDRSKYNIKPIQFNLSLCKTARIHSRNMAETGKVVHNLPGSPTLSERLKGTSLKVLKQGENIASGISVENAQENLMKSPGHREAILDTDFSYVGVGIVKQDDLLYITQNFASFIPDVSPSEGKRALLTKIRQIRTSPIKENSTLSSIAQLHSDKMAASLKLLDTKILKDKLDSRKVKFRQVSFLTIGSPTVEQIFKELKKNRKIQSDTMTEIGIGLRQSGDGNLWVTIILKK